jgi:hypothetical protein
MTGSLTNQKSFFNLTFVYSNTKNKKKQMSIKEEVLKIFIS